MIINTLLIIFFAVLTILSLSAGGDLGGFIGFMSIIAIIILYFAR
jgi:hypothetical protein